MPTNPVTFNGFEPVADSAACTCVSSLAVSGRACKVAIVSCSAATCAISVLIAAAHDASDELTSRGTSLPSVRIVNGDGRAGVGIVTSTNQIKTAAHAGSHRLRPTAEPETRCPCRTAETVNQTAPRAGTLVP